MLQDFFLLVYLLLKNLTELFFKYNFLKNQNIYKHLFLVFVFWFCVLIRKAFPTPKSDSWILPEYVSTLALWTFRTEYFLLGSVLCVVRMFSNVLGLYPLDASSIPCSPVVITKNVSRHCEKPPRRTNCHTHLPTWRTTVLEHT